MQYQVLGVGSLAAAETAAAASLLSGLSPEALAALAQLMARMNGPTAFFGVLFIPSNGGVVTTNPVIGAPDLTVSYDRDTGVVRIWQANAAGDQNLLDLGHIGVDGRFYDATGTVTGARVANGAVIDPDTLPGYRSQSATATGTAARSAAVVVTATQPKLCPDPAPDQPGAPLDNPYQQYIGELINGVALPPGLAVNLWNPVSDRFVHFDNCQLSTGVMIEAKGTGYAAILADGETSFVWRRVEEKMVRQANAQIQAAQGRPIEWYFAERTVADYMTKVFANNGLSITIIYMPPLRWAP
jgi:hypothetical protein